MTRPRRPRWRRSIVAGIAACLTALLSGCVYLRLLQLKNQFTRFEENFQLTTDTGLQLRFLQPILLTSDLRWMGFEPASVNRLGTAEHWHLRWVKQPAAGVAADGAFEIAFDLSFTEDRLSGLTLAEKYFSLLPKDIVVAAIKSLGGAAVDEKKRSVQTSVLSPAGSAVFPTRTMLDAMLGRPTEESFEDDRIVARYRCVSADPAGKGKPLDLKLVFDARTGLLRQTVGRLPVGNVDLNFHPPSTPPRSP